MNGIAISLLTLGLSLASVLTGLAEEPNTEQAKAIAEIEKLGGKVYFDENSPGKPRTVEVRSRVPGVADTVMGHIKAFTQLPRLDLSDSRVTDAGLEHLKGLTQLQSLHLSFCALVTDAGLEHLKDLTTLQLLNLGDTKVTDAGLKHLKGLTRLDTLFLGSTAVTVAGLKDLKGQGFLLAMLSICVFSGKIEIAKRSRGHKNNRIPRVKRS